MFDIAKTLIIAVALFPTYDAPHYKYGYQVLILFGGLAIIGCFLLYIIQGRKGDRTADTSERSPSDEVAHD